MNKFVNRKLVIQYAMIERLNQNFSREKSLMYPFFYGMVV